MKTLQKSGGYAALYLAIAYLIGLILFVVVLDYPSITDPAQKVALLVEKPMVIFATNLFMYVFFGVSLVVLSLALYDRLKAGAPALMQADVGVAMGRSGTDVAREAARIVVTDDNFASIVAAVEEGRVALRNIKKVLLLLLSTSAAEVTVLLGALLLGFPPPFAAVQILWNNLVTEGVIVVNLIMDPPGGNELKRPPTPPGEPLVTRLMFQRMAVMTPAIVLSTLGWFIVRLSRGVPFPQVQSETFTLLAVCEWFNVLNCRSETRSALRPGLLRNPWLVGGLVVGNLLQAAIIFLPVCNDLFHTVPFSLNEVLAIGAVGSLVLWVEEARKLAGRFRRGRAMKAAADAT